MLDLETGKNKLSVGSAVAKRTEAKTNDSKPRKWHEGHPMALTPKREKAEDRRQLTLFLSLEE